MIVESYRTIRLGVKSLLLHKLRSALTTLGILIGVAAVVAMLAIGEGASYEAQQQIKAMGSTNILIQSKKPPAEEADSQGRHFAPDFYGLTYKDRDRIQSTLAPVIEDVVSVRHSDKEIRVGAKWYNGVLLGTTTTYLTVMGMEIREGRWISDTDLRRRANVATARIPAAANGTRPASPNSAGTRSQSEWGVSKNLS